jgi:hypothetical protein
MLPDLDTLVQPDLFFIINERWNIGISETVRSEVLPGFEVKVEEVYPA